MLECIFIHVANGQISLFVHDDAILVDLLNALEIDDIRAVNAHEVVGQSLFYLLHRQQRDNGLALPLDMYFQVLAHTLYVANVADADLHDAVFRLEEDGVLTPNLSFIRLAAR